MPHERYSVAEPDAPRSWNPSQKCRDEVMNLVLGFLLERGETSQKELRRLLGEAMPGTPDGTITANVSASLLHFAQAGWVESTERDAERSQIWRVIG